MPLKPHLWQLRDGCADPFGACQKQMVMASGEFKSALKLPLSDN
jgi:hypothetical protein